MSKVLERTLVMVKISVIVPIYNTEQFLPVCLDSLLQQTEKNLEILAVNNGSTDSSGEILKEYAQRDSRIKVVTRQIHGEVADARNSALSVAAGEYIAFCDSDDSLPPEAYRHLLRKAEQTQCDVVVGSHYNTNDDGEQNLCLLPTKKRASEFELFFCAPCVWNKLIRRSFLEENHLRFPNLIMGEDVLFLAKLLKCQPKISKIMTPVYFYWHHSRAWEPSMTHRYSFEFFSLHLLCREKLLQELKDTKHQKEAEKYVYWSMIYFLQTFLFRIWDGEERKLAFEAFRNHVFEFDWNGYEPLFKSILGMTPDAFRECTAQTYFLQMGELNHREIVLQEYRAGLIGFRYILKYAKAWLEYKMGHVMER